LGCVPTGGIDEVRVLSRAVYDGTSKPPGAIERE
jgi:GMP synthase PP-ATPase subunit